MEVDKAPMGRTLRKRKEKVAQHLKRGTNEKEMEIFQKRVLRIPLEEPFEEAYFTHILWMFFRETRETEEDIRRMFYEARDKMKNMITLKKKSDHGKFAIPCMVKGIKFPHALCDTGASVSILPRVMADHLRLKVEPSKESFIFVDCSQRSSGGIVRDLEVQISNSLVLVNFHVLDIKLNRNSSLLLGRAFLSIVGAVCNMQTNRLCLALIDPHVHYDPIPVTKPQTSSRRINNPGLIAACHCGAELETDHLEESIDSSPDDWENDYYNPTLAVHTATPLVRATLHTKEYDEDYEEERAIEYRGIRTEEDRLLHHSYRIRNATSIDRTILTSIDTHHPQTNRKRSSTDIAYYTLIDDGVDRAQEGDYSIGSWADDLYHESYAVETAVHDPGASELHECFTTEELLNHQECSDTDSLFAVAWGRGTRFYRPLTRTKHPSINIKASTSIDIHSQPPSIVREKAKQNNNYLKPDEFGIFRDSEGYAKATDGHALQVSREDIAYILQMANGAENIFMKQCNIPEHQQRVANESYNTAGGVDYRPAKVSTAYSTVDRH
ncbi:hypothetical protein F2Q69_00006604 [Brassica cretica]|uniref:Aspartic peptidase DDI1-type domain-containing protein n=1 Tax=Brassica cretica TaxID=69181 RepID=A0A8S9NWW0_BRACR|nr:hypothetical protein F2Q69_00006604 [Brassica cretica]